MRKFIIIMIVLLIFLCNYEIPVQSENINTPNFSYTFLNYVGTSNISEDDAWYNATKQAFDSNQISEAEWEYEYFEYMEDKCYTEVENLNSSTSYGVNSITDNNSIITGKITSNVSENGSYILSSGIIILVEEDIKSYFDGTLTFHQKDEDLY